MPNNGENAFPHLVNRLVEFCSALIGAWIVWQGIAEASIASYLER